MMFNLSLAGGQPVENAVFMGQDPGDWDDPNNWKTYDDQNNMVSTATWATADRLPCETDSVSFPVIDKEHEKLFFLPRWQCSITTPGMSSERVDTDTVVRERDIWSGRCGHFTQTVLLLCFFVIASDQNLPCDILSMLVCPFSSPWLRFWLLLSSILQSPFQCAQWSDRSMLLHCRHLCPNRETLDLLP